MNFQVLFKDQFEGKENCIKCGSQIIYACHVAKIIVGFMEMIRIITWC